MGCLPSQKILNLSYDGKKESFPVDKTWEGCGYEDLRKFAAEKFGFSNEYQIVFTYPDPGDGSERRFGDSQEYAEVLYKTVFSKSQKMSTLEVKLIKAEDNDGKKLLSALQANADIRNILALKGKLDYEDSKGDYPLAHAIKSMETHTVMRLLDAKAPVDHVGKDKQFPLYMAVSRANKPITKLLIEAKANINLSTKNDDGSINGALLSAVSIKEQRNYYGRHFDEWDRFALLKMLLLAKADPKGPGGEKILLFKNKEIVVKLCKELKEHGVNYK
mmetsp:Transcript_2941/g.4029  ORF Transcript_2941/g.4029 Transcript_2941/m.4029 type:complete len:275 (-) Transcript_2941:221-1045(-)|eukprot:CAMPEP_0185256658 /NCGR_PEP_ID=MMETSP1359-20130426/5737_1 /TAXON_ID=552665 /ORGANISM="Bigelowiella longifila, Strain CCMP242" /LENGTH=274 /DNA_ID=CAMNT_0027841335 /DNA_START=363 /DNA_END=1187 /DNA_ORIENTATION=+